jgi:hypothetical protein
MYGKAERDKYCIRTKIKTPVQSKTLPSSMQLRDLVDEPQKSKLIRYFSRKKLFLWSMIEARKKNPHKSYCYLFEIKGDQSVRTNIYCQCIFAVHTLYIHV